MFALAIRNLLRHRFRTAMTIASIVFGVAGLVVSGGFVHDIYIQLAEALIHSQSGHVQIAPKGFFDAGTRGGSPQGIAAPEALIRELSGVPGVENAMARVHFSGLLNNGRADWAIMGEGVEPGKEAMLGTYLRVIAGRTLRDGDRHAALIGQGVAQVLRARPGDPLTLVVNTAEGALNTIDVDVVGVFQTFSKDYDARAIRVPLADAHELVGSTNADVIVVALKRTPDTDVLAQGFRSRMSDRGVEVKTWRELNDYFEKTVALYGRQFGVLQVIILVMVLLAVANTVNMNALERTGEFGTMRALGNRGADVSRLVMYEAVLLGLAGGIIGLVLGTLIALAISAIGIPMPPPPNANLGYTARVQVVPAELAQAFLVGAFATIIAAVLPARRAARVSVVDALRENV